MEKELDLENTSYSFYTEMIECIRSAINARDSYTAQHVDRVGNMTARVCELIGISGNNREKISLAAQLHDVGKIGIPDAVLNKPTRLSEEEWNVIKQHPVIGKDILCKSKYLSELEEIVLHHHERFDGLGYPGGLKADEIPVGSRIIAICDSIDAMTSDRAYRMALDMGTCRMEIEKNLGKMYDPVIGQFVLDHWDEVTYCVQR